jgi:hypothetical protein
MQNLNGTNSDTIIAVLVNKVEQLERKIEELDNRTASMVTIGSCDPSYYAFDISEDDLDIEAEPNDNDGSL